MAIQTQKQANVKLNGQAQKSRSHVNEVLDKTPTPRPARVRLSREEIRARMNAFEKEREEEFVAAVRKDEN